MCFDSRHLTCCGWLYSRLCCCLQCGHNLSRGVSLYSSTALSDTDDYGRKFRHVSSNSSRYVRHQDACRRGNFIELKPVSPDLSWDYIIKDHTLFSLKRGLAKRGWLGVQSDSTWAFLLVKCEDSYSWTCYYTTVSGQTLTCLMDIPVSLTCLMFWTSSITDWNS